jgi:hypothetical protein
MIWVTSRAASKMLEADAVWFPSRVINRCPATMFAISRTAKVRGRITLLIDSISTMKGIRAPGVLWGTRCANIWFVMLNHPNIMKASHRGRDRAMVSAMCLEDVKM